MMSKKGCSKYFYGTKEQLPIKKMILENSRRVQKNLSVTQIDYRKAYDSVPHTWIKEIMKIYKINERIINFIEKATWKIRMNFEIGAN